MADQDTIHARLAALRAGRLGNADLPRMTRERRVIAGAEVRGHAGFEGRVKRAREQERDRRGRPTAVSAFEASSSPFESLVFNQRLRTNGEAENVAEIRAQAGFMFRNDIEMAQISTLSAKPISDSGGGGGGKKGMLADAKIYAMQSVGRLREMMPRGRFKLLEDVIVNDVWVFEWVARRKAVTPKEKKAHAEKAHAHRSMKISEILCGLDSLAVHYDLLRYPDFQRRWPGAQYGRRKRRGG